MKLTTKELLTAVGAYRYIVRNISDKTESYQQPKGGKESKESFKKIAELVNSMIEEKEFEVEVKMI